MAELRNTKTLLAKLLATENISVQYRNAQTASFNPTTRVLTLPIWDNMSPELYDLLGGHEVGHALETPAEGWHDAVSSKYGPGFRSFLNVVEDARIERKIKERFPGIRKSFVKGYGELVDRGFFGVNLDEVNSLILIDRINIHFKLGAIANVRFNEAEQAFVKKIEAVNTWEDVVAVSKELYDYCRQEIQDSIDRANELREMMQDMADEDMEFETTDVPDFNDDYDFDEQSASGDGEGEGEETDKTSEVKKPGNSTKEGEEVDDENQTDGVAASKQKEQVTASDELDELEKIEKRYGKQGSGEIKPVSVTDQAYQEKVKTLGESKAVVNSIMPSVKQMKLDDLVVSWKTLAGHIANVDTEMYNTRFINDFEKRNANAIAYLVKEFEMRKKASEYRRVSVSDTGMIDTNLLHSYKFNDNIFRKMASVADGKNHGMVMVIDWSGSMQDNLAGTIEQLMVLTMFCRKINVPFEVYAFSTEYRGVSNWLEVRQAGEIELDRGFNLLQLLSNTMSNQAYRKQANDLLALAKAYEIASDRKYSYDQRIKASRMIAPGMGLGGTPLNATIAALSKIVADFKTKNRVDIVTTVVLTDGDDDLTASIRGGGYYERVCPETAKSISYVSDADTKKTYRVKNSITQTLLEILKDRTGTNLIGFYITPKRKSNFESLWNKFSSAKYDFAEREKAYSEFKDQKVYGFQNVGYDEYYMIPGGEDLAAEDEDLDDIIGSNTKVTQGKLKNAFLKMNQGRLTNRVLLRKFIEQVA